MVCESVQLEMLAAVETGDLREVDRLVSRHGLYGIEDYPGGSHLLTRALWRSHQDVAMLLLRKGAEVNCRRADCYYGCLSLHLACKRGYKDIISMLIEKGADINVKDNRKRTPVYYSCRVDIVETLLTNNAVIDMADIWGNTPLHHLLIDPELSLLNKLELLNLFVGYGALPISRKGSLMHELIDHRSDPELLRAVLVYWKHRLEVKHPETGDTALLFAVREGQMEASMVLAEEGADLNARDATGSAPLHIAVQKFAASFKREQGPVRTGDESRFESNNFYKIMKTLLGTGYNIDINTKDDKTCTALHYAVQNACPPAITMLLNAGADPDAVTCTAQTPLFLAVTRMDGSSIKTLLDHGADLSVLKRYKALVIDLVESDVDSLTLEAVLIKGKSWLDLETRAISGDTALHLAIRKCSPSKVYALIQHGARLDARNADDMCPLHLAVKLYGGDHYSHRVVRAILEGLARREGTDRIVDLTDGMGTALHHAIDYQSAELVELLLKHGADVNAPNRAGQTPLELAATRTPPPRQSGRFYTAPPKSITQILLDNDADVFASLPNGKTVINSALSAGGNLEPIVEHLLKHKQCDRRDVNGNTVLHYFAETGNYVYVRRLVPVIDPDSVNNLGETPLHIATRAGRYGIVQILLEGGANALARTNEGLTALHIAARSQSAWGERSSSIEVLSKRIIRLGGEKSIEQSGKTALHYAVDHCSVGNVDELFSHGLGWDNPDFEGKTALHLALDKGNRYVLGSLMKHLIGEFNNDISRRCGIQKSCQNPNRIPTIDDELCGHDFVRLHKTIIGLILILEEIAYDIDAPNVECDKFLLALIVDSSLCIPKLAKIFHTGKLYWLDGKTSSECLLMKLPGAMKDASAKLAIRLFEARLPCGKELLARVCVDGLEELELACAEEVARLERAKMGNYKSLYDFLHDNNPNAFKTFFNPKSQDDEIRRLLFLDDFPLYRDLIMSKIWRDSKRIELLSRARISILQYLDEGSALIKLIKLKDIAENILNNLTNLELMSLIEFELSNIFVQSSEKPDKAIKSD